MSSKNARSNSDFSILILAAGSSSRLGRPKQLIERDGKSLLENAIQCAMEVSNCVHVVLGAGAKEIKPTITHLECHIWTFESWEEGMGSTLSFGVKKILENEKPSSILVSVCDQPFLTTEVFEKLISSQDQSGIVASSYGDSFGVPATFNQSLYPQLLALSGDKGAKILMRESITALIPFPKGEIDIDTEADLIGLN